MVDGGETTKYVLEGISLLQATRQADPRMVRDIRDWLATQPEIDDVVDLLTMLTGTDRVLLCARVDFVDSYNGRELTKPHKQ